MLARASTGKKEVRAMLKSHRIDVELLFNLHVNDTSFRFTGYSRGVPGNGTPIAVLDTDDAIPRGFHVSLLSYVALTGHPFMSRSVDGAENPFLRTGGIYSATRRLDLGQRGHLVTDYRVDRGGPGLVETFDVSGNVDVPALMSIEPTVETWVPGEPGRIYGHFVMVWTGQDGSRVRGKAETDYRLDMDDTIPGVQFRDIRIELSCTETHLSQREQIVIFTPAHLNAFLTADAAAAEDAVSLWTATAV
jgi:hypothetical protein